MIEALKKLKKRAEEAEGELTIIKGIGQNSPEMKALQKENEDLKKQKHYLQDQLRKAGNSIKELNTTIGITNDELTVKTLQVNQLEKIRKQVLVSLKEMKDDLNDDLKKYNKDDNGH
jgi:chromosome segregation ATPase